MEIGRILTKCFTWREIHVSHAGADSTTIHLPLCLSLSAEWTTASHQKTSVRKASSVLDICWQSTVPEGIETRYMKLTKVKADSWEAFVGDGNMVLQCSTWPVLVVLRLHNYQASENRTSRFQTHCVTWPFTVSRGYRRGTWRSMQPATPTLHQAIDLHIQLKHLKPGHPESTHCVTCKCFPAVYINRGKLHMSPANILVQAVSCWETLIPLQSFQQK